MDTTTICKHFIIYIMQPLYNYSKQALYNNNMKSLYYYSMQSLYNYSNQALYNYNNQALMKARLKVYGGQWISGTVDWYCDSILLFSSVLIHTKLHFRLRHIDIFLCAICVCLYLSLNIRTIKNRAQYYIKQVDIFRNVWFSILHV